MAAQFLLVTQGNAYSVCNALKMSVKFIAENGGGAGVPRVTLASHLRL